MAWMNFALFSTSFFTVDGMSCAPLVIKERNMKRFFRTFLSRFRRQPQDPLHERTMAQSQVEDFEDQHPDSPERRAFDEASYERRQDSLHHSFGTSSHGGDNPIREKNP
jgi:hypothetical protein